MGNCGNKGNDEEREQAKIIEADLKKDSKEFLNTMRLLLLGAGESGKSTVAKQMKIIHLNGFDDAEKKTYVDAIHYNIATSAKALLDACTDLEIKHGVSSETVELLEDYVGGVMAPELGQKLKDLWADEGIQEAYSRRNEFQLNDSTQYYLDQLDRVTAKGFVPTDQDIIRSRIQTTGIIETNFSYDRYHFCLVDVGGQRSERKKWMHCFEDVTAVLFVVGISEFDQKLYEDGVTNRMHESLQLFRSMCGSKWFAKTPIILFLNKSDLFKEKIESGKSIRIAFPEYPGEDTVEDSVEFIEAAFKTDIGDRSIYTHLTNATDTSNVKKVFLSVKEYVTEKAISGMGVGGF